LNDFEKLFQQKIIYVELLNVFEQVLPCKSTSNFDARAEVLIQNWLFIVIAHVLKF